MRKRAALWIALLLPLLGLALVRRDAASDPYAPELLAALLQQPLDRRPGAASEANPVPFERALLEHPANARADGGVHLRLGRVLADPTIARGAAESAGELLALDAAGPDGPLGVPLWRALLDGPATEHGPGGRMLALYGCRHSADAEAAPGIEDSYHARRSLARALEELARGERDAQPLFLRGVETPARGGVNFEVQLAGERQSLVVTFDGRPGPFLSATRSFRPTAPNDARVRARLVTALRALVPAERLTLEGETEPVDGGVELRVEIVGPRLGLTAKFPDGTRLATHLEREE